MPFHRSNVLTLQRSPPAPHAGPAADLDLTTAYVDRFHEPAAGKRHFVRICALKDGFKAALVQVGAIVAPHGA